MATQVREVQARPVESKPVEARVITTKTEFDDLTFGVDSLVFNGEQLTYGV